MSGSLSSLYLVQPAVRGRVSSYDPTGGNRDFWTVPPGTAQTIANIKGCGCVRHIWMTVGGMEPALGRRLIIRMFWDGETQPSVEAPLTDFFGMGYGMFRQFASAPLQMAPDDGHGMNCWFPMPYRSAARIEVENQGALPHDFYFYIDYDELADLPDEAATFHAQWRRENPTQGWLRPERKHEFEADIWSIWQSEEALNTTGKENYVILEAEGCGHYVGCNMHVDCFERQCNDWYGEGDDMIFIDGSPLPTLHGTGTEDYFCQAYCPRSEYSTPYHGIILYSGSSSWPWGGKNSLYRYHIEDPVHFKSSIKVTIEHGHGNKLSLDYSSTAYWYQLEPHMPFNALPSLLDRLPRP